jgi:hypothetical protein
MNDTPTLPLNPATMGKGKIRMDFQTFLIFNPGGSEDSWVPLKKVTWHWGAEWVDNPGGPQPFVVTLSGSSISPTTSDPEFPAWFSTYTPANFFLVPDRDPTPPEEWDLSLQ